MNYYKSIVNNTTTEHKMTQVTYSELLDIIDSLNETKLDEESKKETYIYTMENNRKMYTIKVFWNTSMLCGTSRWDFDATRM